MCMLALLTGCGGQEDAASQNDSSTPVATSADAVLPASLTSDHPLNVLLITMDTTRADALGVYGQPLPVTPNIDRLARKGVVFRNAMSAAPLTLPSHASIMTGVYPFVHGARSNDVHVLSEENRTLAEVLQGRGYRTGAEISAAVLNRRTGMNQGFDSYRDIDSPGIQQVTMLAPAEGKPEEVMLDERYASDVTAGGIAFLRTVHDSPFFLWLHYFAPHDPYIPPEEMAKPFPDQPYLGEVHYTDYAIGKMVEALAEQELLENTLIVITADHGESLGEHGEYGHSFLAYDTTVHVPLIFYRPGWLPNTHMYEPIVRTIDIAPTILDLLGYPPLKGVQGRSLLPLLANPERDPGMLAYGETSQTLLYFGGSVVRYVRRGEWKYIHKLNPEIYDLRDDPNETQNLFDAQPKRVEEFRKTLRDILDSAPRHIKSRDVTLSPLERSQLERLGYMTTSSKSQANDEMESLEVHEPDPNDALSDVGQFFGGLAAASLNNYDEAIPIFEGLVARHPDGQRFIQAYLRALLRTKQYTAAQKVIDENLRRGSALDTFWPNFVAGVAKAIDAQDDEGLGILEGLIGHEPCNAGTVSKLIEAYQLRGRFLDERKLLENRIARCEPSLEDFNNLSYLLATCSDGSVRDGAKAVELALRGAEMTGYREPAVLDTLAAAYAESGDFERAASTSRKALDLLNAQQVSEERLENYRAHLALFTAGEALREAGAP